MNPTARHRAAPPQGTASPPLWAAARGCLRAGLFLLCASFPAQLGAQQLATDDAGIVDYRACQLEAWHGQCSSWLLPACSPVRNPELTFGLGWRKRRTPAGTRRDSYALSWGFRADFVLAERPVALGEVFGGSHDSPTAYQPGVRVRLVRDRRAVDTTGGDNTAPGVAGPGWTIGLAWTPPPFGAAARKSEAR